jgi:hypothetical protein
MWMSRQLTRGSALSRLALAAVLLVNVGCSEGASGPIVWFTDGTKVTDADIPRRVPLNTRSFSAKGIALTDVTAKYLGRCRYLEKLNLEATRITDGGMKNLAVLRNLEELNLSFCEITDEGLKSISGLEKLKYVGLTGTDVTDAGMTYLSRLKSLQCVELAGTAVTASRARQLKKELPHADRITWTTVASADVRHAVVDLARIGLSVLTFQFDDRVPARHKSDTYLINFGEGWNSKLSATRAHELIKIISDKEAVSLQFDQFTQSERTVLSGLSHLYYLNIVLSGKTTLDDFSAPATIGRIESVRVWGKNFDDAKLEALSGAHGLESLDLETEGILTAKGLDCLSRLKKLSKVELLFDGASDECLPHVAKIASLKELGVRSSVSRKAIDEFRLKRPDVRIQVREGFKKDENENPDMVP